MAISLRFEVLYKNEVVCSVNCQDDTINKEYFTDNILKSGIPRHYESWKQVMLWFESRCFPRTRDRGQSRILLQDLGLIEYNPLGIVRKTHGVTPDDFYWIRFEGEMLCWDDVRVR